MPPHHSVGGIPLRKQRSKAPYGDKGRQPGAKLPDLDYVAYHGTYGEFGTMSDPNSTFCNQKDYRKRKPLPLDQPRGGFVTRDDAHVIRQRNLPLLFHKQFSEVGRWTDPKLNQAYLVLFPDGSRYKSQEPEFRPNPGCIQTRFWSDEQVDTWLKFSMLYGIKYSGRTEYQIPRDLMGYHKHTINYASNRPWPKPGRQDILRSFKPAVKRRRKRSELRRILRSLERRDKREVHMKPLGIESVLKIRKVDSRKTINRNFGLCKSEPISSYRRNYPECLSLAFGPPAQVSQIVLDSLRKIYSRPKKFLNDLTWIIPEGKSVGYDLQMKVAPSKAKHEKARKIVTLHSDKGGVFRAMYGTGHQAYLVDTNFNGIIKDSESRLRVLSKMHEWQAILDSDSEDEYPAGTTLGGWFD